MSNLKNKTQAVRNFLSKVTELKCCKKLDYNVDCCGNNRVAFIVANPYYECYRLKLGDPCCNDANLIAEFYRDHGYKCFGIIDPTKEEFLMYLNHFTSRSDIHDLIVYYAGHGGSIPDRSFKYVNGKCVACEKDEEDGRDETWVFKNGDLVDDEVREIWDNNKCGNILVISDSCHSGSVVETSKNNVSSFCGCKDSQTSLQLQRNGIFTYFLMDYAKKNTVLKSLQVTVNKKLNDYGQNCVLTGNRERLVM